MANSYNQNPIYIDTVASNLDLANLAFGSSNVALWISKIRLINPASANKIVLKDGRGKIISQLTADAAGKDVETYFEDTYSCVGLQMLSADQTLTQGYALIYFR